MRTLTDTTAFPTGVLRAIEWSLNEIADNVLVHAGEHASGWIQLTSYPQKEQVEFVVVDTGRGIRASLSEAYPDLATDQEALSLAVQKGITRDREIGQGNGLSGLLRIARAAEGWVNIHSGAGLLRWMGTDVQSRGVPRHRGTLVTTTLPVAKPIDLSAALWGREPLPAFEADYLDDAGMTFRLRDEASGFGNRITARRLRRRLTNLMTSMPDERVVIDFSDVDLVSASFADEFIAKLVKEMGPIHFFGKIQLRHMSQFVASSVDEVIRQRMAT